MGPARLDPDEGAGPAPLEDGHHHAEGGTDGQEVHGRRGERDDEAPEDDGQEEEGEDHHQPDEERELGGEHRGKSMKPAVFPPT